MADGKIKTLLIDDSGFMRIFLSDLLRGDQQIEVLATANNGKDGVEKVKALRPDVVVTDMVMPHYDGLYVVRQLMKEMPLPIILLSSLDRADPIIFDALNEGAFDFVDKPQDKDKRGGFLKLSKLIKEASLADRVAIRRRSLGRNSFDHTFDSALQYDIIVIGASTGGPGAVEHIVNNLPANLSIPIVVAQHMPGRFIETFAKRLADSTGLRISVAQDGEPLVGNCIYLAPGFTNIKVASLPEKGPHIVYVNENYKEYNNPSIDCLFESVANTFGSRAMAAILTGMGRDGAQGLLRIREAGGFTVAQDAESCIVYGMPKNAVESGAAMYQVALHEIPNFLITAL